MKEWFKVYKWNILVWSAIFMGSTFLGFLGARSVQVVDDEPSKTDTIYVGNGMADSLLQDIAVQLKDINRKIPEKKPWKKRKPQKDTIWIDASLHIENIGERN